MSFIFPGISPMSANPGLLLPAQPTPSSCHHHHWQLSIQLSSQRSPTTYCQRFDRKHNQQGLPRGRASSLQSPSGIPTVDFAGGSTRIYSDGGGICFASSGCRIRIIGCVITMCRICFIISGFITMCRICFTASGRVSTVAVRGIFGGGGIPRFDSSSANLLFGVPAVRGGSGESSGCGGAIAILWRARVLLLNVFFFK